MITLRILDFMSLKIISLKKSDSYPTKQFKIVFLNILSVSVSASAAMDGAVGIHIELLPLRLFIGFNINKRLII